MRFIILWFVPLTCWASAAPESRLATGQGIAAPNVTMLVNLSRGFTAENPAGVMAQDGFTASALMAKNVDTDSAFEAGYGGKTYGVAAGMLMPGCAGCKSTTAGILGMSFDKTAAAGVRYQTQNGVPTYGAGVIFNQAGTHRLGVNVDRYAPAKPAYSATSIGGGYAYVTKATTIALEISKKQSDDPAATTTNKIMTASLGFQKRVDPLMVSIAYETRMSDTAKPNDLMWMGAGFDSSNWNLQVFVNYRQQMMVVLGAYF